MLLKIAAEASRVGEVNENMNLERVEDDRVQNPIGHENLKFYAHDKVEKITQLSTNSNQDSDYLRRIMRVDGLYRAMQALDAKLKWQAMWNLSPACPDQTLGSSSCQWHIQNFYKLWEDENQKVGNHIKPVLRELLKLGQGQRLSENVSNEDNEVLVQAISCEVVVALELDNDYQQDLRLKAKESQGHSFTRPIHQGEFLRESIRADVNYVSP